MRFRALCGTILPLLGLSVAEAQKIRGTLRGTVQDPSGARIPSARIVAESPDSALQARSGE